MTTNERDEMRELQNQLIALVEKNNINMDLPMSVNYPGCPTTRDLLFIIYPEWKTCIKETIQFIKQEYK
jgi:hypothetical protein